MGIVIDDVLASLVRARAEAIDLPPSRYAAMIIEHWQKTGAAPVSEPDRLMQVAQKTASTLPEAAPKKNLQNPASSNAIAPSVLAAKAGRQLTTKTKK